MGATVLGAAVIWPSLRGQQVTQRTQAAARAATRLLFLTTSALSSTRPTGLLQFHLPAVMASQGRWAVFASLAWVQGALLRVGAATACTVSNFIFLSEITQLLNAALHF
jgi:hypothetical protein